MKFKYQLFLDHKQIMDPLQGLGIMSKTSVVAALI